MATLNGDDPEPGQEQPKEPTQQSKAQHDIAQDIPVLRKTSRMSGSFLPNPLYKNYEFEGVMRTHDDREHEGTEEIAAKAIDLPPPPRLDALAKKDNIVHELPGGLYSKRFYNKDLCARIPGPWMIETLEAEKVHIPKTGDIYNTGTFTNYRRREDRGDYRGFRGFARYITGRHTGHTRKNEYPYLVLGIFSRADNVPTEIRVEIRSPAYLFTTLSWGIMRLRGLAFWFSLREVKQFKLYKVFLS